MVAVRRPAIGWVRCLGCPGGDKVHRHLCYRMMWVHVEVTAELNSHKTAVKYSN